MLIFQEEKFIMQILEAINKNNENDISFFYEKIKIIFLS